ncbi:MAG: hypothetical protein R2780_08935 [Crocinitomicaceae bacterium]|nr:hypothetical protein [Crocinitomicaceae bacterium]
MSDTKKLIASLDEKVELLLNKIKEEQAFLATKKQELEELKKDLTAKESQIVQLKAENESLKNAPVQNNDDSEEMKARISELVREIDNCISLLKV